MARSASFNQHLTSNIQHPFSEKTNGTIHRSRMPAVPARRDETVSERRALLFREMRHRKAQLCSRTTWKTKKMKKTVGYGLQLREKQKVRRIYGVLETQFRNNYEKATMMKGIAGDNMLGLLERRLDNVIYRMGLGTSRAQARQIVRHGHIQINGRKCNIPSALVKPEDLVEVRESSRQNPTILSARDTTAHAPSPGWMEVDKEALRARITGQPRRDELVQIQLNEQLIVELYSK